MLLPLWSFLLLLFGASLSVGGIVADASNITTGNGKSTLTLAPTILIRLLTCSVAVVIATSPPGQAVSSWYDVNCGCSCKLYTSSTLMPSSPDGLENWEVQTVTNCAPSGSSTSTLDIPTTTTPGIPTEVARSSSKTQSTMLSRSPKKPSGSESSSNLTWAVISSLGTQNSSTRKVPSSGFSIQTKAKTSTSTRLATTTSTARTQASLSV